MRGDPLDGDEFPSHYEERVRARRASRGTLPPCGIFLLEGAVHAAPSGGEAEAHLLREGALRIGAVTFDGAAVAALTGGTAARGEVLRVTPRRLARAADGGRREN